MHFTISFSTVVSLSTSQFALEAGQKERVFQEGMDGCFVELSLIFTRSVRRMVSSAQVFFRVLRRHQQVFDSHRGSFPSLSSLFRRSPNGLCGARGRVGSLE